MAPRIASKPSSAPTVAPFFPITHSTLAASALATQLLPAFDLPDGMRCRLWHRGLNDTYIVESGDQRYVLRIYRAGWRTLSDVQYEVQVLHHLRQRGLPVSCPIPRRDGEYITTLAAAEGTRYAVCFTHADGAPLPFDNEDALYRYGALIAAIHTASEDFTSPHSRFALDLQHLVLDPVAATLPHVQKPEEARYLQTCEDLLCKRLLALPLDALEWGFCHGDTHNWNVHVGRDQQPADWMMIFDFDCCGPGWRAYDLATFRWSANWETKNTDQWLPFLQGYTAHRPLSAVDRAAIPIFTAMRQIWFLGLRMANGQEWGYEWPMVTDEIAFLQTCMELSET